MRHFSQFEFGIWYEAMSPRLLELLDAFREAWGRPVRISPDGGALGRHLGPDATSQHNWDRWGEVRAADVIPAAMISRPLAESAIVLAKSVGFTGIGLYTFWASGPGLHLDVRADRLAGDPALWGQIAYKGPYIAIEAALNEMP